MSIDKHMKMLLRTSVTGLENSTGDESDRANELNLDEIVEKMRKKKIELNIGFIHMLELNKILDDTEQKRKRRWIF